VAPSVHLLTAALLAAGIGLPAAAQTGIYSCVDARGRHVTADRPIPECSDREQKELNPSGSIRRKVPPTLSPQERAQEEEKARLAQQDKARLADERKRHHALITRYPDKAAHDKERRAALAVADEMAGAARRRIAALAEDRQRLNAELEFYQKDPARAPAHLKRQIEENEQHTGAQQRFVASQEGEKQRINARFDDELAQLRELWLGKAQTPVAPASAVRPAVR